LVLHIALSLDTDFSLSVIPPNQCKKRKTLKRFTLSLLLYEVWVFASYLLCSMYYS